MGFSVSDNLADTEVFNNQGMLECYEVIKNKKTSKFLHLWKNMRKPSCFFLWPKVAGMKDGSA